MATDDDPRPTERQRPSLDLPDTVLDALGEHIATHFIAAKEGAWHEFIAQVHPWELERYLGRF